MLQNQIGPYFKARRDRLMKENPGAVFIFQSNAQPLRNPDVSYAFRQESNFYYLTGFDEPNSYLVLAPTSSSTYKMVLFVMKRDLGREMWNGERYGSDRAVSVFGATESHTNDEFEDHLPELLRGADRVMFRLGKNRDTDAMILSALESHRASFGRSGRGILPIEDPSPILGEMRLFKTAEELVLIRKACKASGLAHTAAMKEVRPGMNEYEIEALIDYTFRKNGCERVGYSSIVAGGKNAACLHYAANNELLRDGDLLLIDAGGEFGYYSSDITRTFPVGRTFSKSQAQVYDLVLKAEKEAIAMTKPGVTLPAIHRHACEVMTEGLLSLGLLRGSREDILKTNGYSRFFPHRTSHYMGMDVHDVGLYIAPNGEPRPLEAGMVFTVEPGFYVQPADRDVPSAFQKIGIRIEDDILVTPAGYENLTADCPKERCEIEALKV